MVILSAKYEKNDDLGNPTVVVAGVNKSNVAGEYNSLSIPLAADQQPPTASLVNFPSSAQGLTSITIKVVV